MLDSLTMAYFLAPIVLALALVVIRQGRALRRLRREIRLRLI